MEAIQEVQETTEPLALAERKRLRAYGAVLAALGLPDNALDGKGEEERQRVIDAAIRARADELRRDASDRALGIGVDVTLGGEPFEIRPLPAGNADRWRKAFRAEQTAQADKAQDIEARSAALADEGGREIFIYNQTMQLIDEKMECNTRLLTKYLEFMGAALPETATDEEIEAAVSAAQMLAFRLPGMGARAATRTGQSNGGSPA